MFKEIPKKAILNNASWCEAVCKSNRSPGETLKMIWLNKNSVPPLYPNAITLEPISINNNEKVMYRLIDSIPHDNFTVKDSYADLDLASNGFSILFEAEWIVYSDLDYITPKDYSGWKIIKNKVDFEKWNSAWLKKNSTGKEFTLSLLFDKDTHFLGRFLRGEITNGAILYKSNGVFGLSNAFSTTKIDNKMYQDIVCLTRKKISLLPIVGYEREMDLKSAIEAGFESIGHFKVWSKNKI